MFFRRHYGLWAARVSDRWTIRSETVTKGKPATVSSRRPSSRASRFRHHPFNELHPRTGPALPAPFRSVPSLQSSGCRHPVPDLLRGKRRVQARGSNLACDCLPSGRVFLSRGQLPVQLAFRLGGRVLSRHLLAGMFSLICPFAIGLVLRVLWRVVVRVLGCGITHHACNPAGSTGISRQPAVCGNADRRGLPDRSIRRRRRRLAGRMTGCTCPGWTRTRSGIPRSRSNRYAGRARTSRRPGSSRSASRRPGPSSWSQLPPSCRYGPGSDAW